jgi:hypothetical protein
MDCVAVGKKGDTENLIARGVLAEHMGPMLTPVIANVSRKGEIMKRMFRILVVLVVSSVAVFHGPLGAVASETSATPPIKVVMVSGTNYEMGVQYGEQAAELIAANREATWNLLDTRVTDNSGTPLGRSVILKDIEVWTYYLEKYNPKLKDWLVGISEGCKNKGFEVSYVDLVAIMVLPQEVWARPQMPYPAETNVTAFAPGKGAMLSAKGRTNTQPMSSCSAFAATGSATQGGVPMVSLTLGFLSEIKQYVILVAFPADGERFVNLTMAGKITNNTGMNRRYAWIMTAAVTDPRDCPSSWGVPSEVYHHYLQQYCKSPAEAVSYLESTPRGGVTGIFLFADRSGDVFVYETGGCASAVRRPGKLGETDFVISTNHYNDPSMIEYNIKDFEEEVLGFSVFPDTYPRYETVWQKLLPQALAGQVDLDFAKALWLSNNWYDVTTNIWHTVPVPNDPSDLNTCNVPGNNCEGGESQVVQFPAQRTAYLQSGGPHGTSIQYYWPDDPKPTGEYTKWQLRDSIHEVAETASNDALKMIETAWDSFMDKADTLDRETRRQLKRLLIQATQAWWKGRMEEVSAEKIVPGRRGNGQKAKMARWSAACTNYATAQLYSQMVTTKLNRLGE